MVWLKLSLCFGFHISLKAAMNNNLAKIQSFFTDRHIPLKADWLRMAQQCLKISNRPLNDQIRFIYDQWLRLDLKFTTDPSFQRPTINFFSKRCVFQIVSIVDISISIHQQKKKDGDLEIETPMNTKIEDDFKVPSKRMYLLELSDGQTTVKAVEHEMITTLIKQRPGCKILLYGSARFIKDILLLTPSNCQVLGVAPAKISTN